MALDLGFGVFRIGVLRTKVLLLSLLRRRVLLSTPKPRNPKPESDNSSILFCMCRWLAAEVEGPRAAFTEVLIITITILITIIILSFVFLLFLLVLSL